MRYTIGVQLFDKHRQVYSGYYMLTKYGGGFVMKDKLSDEGNSVLIFSDIEEAKDYVSKLSKRHRNDFRRSARKSGTDLQQYRFYLKKIDSPSFTSLYKLDKEIDVPHYLRSYKSISNRIVKNA